MTKSEILQFIILLQRVKISISNMQKNNLSEGECVTVLDFAENYSFIVQDAVQGFHWNSSPATIHPFVIYYANSEKSSQDCLDHLSIACVSNHLQHDTVAVYSFQKVVLEYLKVKLPMLKKMIYVSDRCGGQYKNYKNFMNLIKHCDDFALDAECNFLATSHGKNACDSVGGTVKRLAARASLQRAKEKQILTQRQLYESASEEISGITSFYVSSDNIQRNRLFLENRFSLGKTIPGTCSYHCFVPISDTEMRFSRISGEGEPNVIHGDHAVPDNQYDIEKVEVGSYIGCLYHRQWYVGLVQDLSFEQNEVNVKFMHPKGPAKAFFWPDREDNC